MLATSALFSPESPQSWLPQRSSVGCSGIGDGAIRARPMTTTTRRANVPTSCRRSPSRSVEPTGDGLLPSARARARRGRGEERRDCDRGVRPAGRGASGPVVPVAGKLPVDPDPRRVPRDVTTWAAWCAARGVDVVHPTPGDVTARVGELRAAGRAEATLARKVSAVCSFYRWARHEGVTDADPTPFRRPRPDRDAVITLGLDPAQVHAVLDAALSRGDTQRYHPFVSLLVFCGLRVSEALGADVDDLADARGHRVIRVTGKGGKPRSVPMPPLVIGAADAYLDGREDGPVFVPPVPGAGGRAETRGRPSRPLVGGPGSMRCTRTRSGTRQRRSCWTPAPPWIGSRSCSATLHQRQRWGTRGHGIGWTSPRCTTSPGTWRTQLQGDPGKGPVSNLKLAGCRSFVPGRPQGHTQRPEDSDRADDDDERNYSCPSRQRRKHIHRGPSPLARSGRVRRGRLSSAKFPWLC